MSEIASKEPYPPEQWCEEVYGCKNPEHGKGEYGCALPQDCGQMQENVDELKRHVVGHKIVKAEQTLEGSKYRYAGLYASQEKQFVLTLDNGLEVVLKNGGDCCAFTNLEKFLLHPELVDHVITGVGTTEGFEKWHIYCDLGDILELEVGWSPGNPFYYGYGFDIEVYILGEVVAEDAQKAIESPGKAIEQ